MLLPLLNANQPKMLLNTVAPRWLNSRHYPPSWFDFNARPAAPVPTEEPADASECASDAERSPADLGPVERGT